MKIRPTDVGDTTGRLASIVTSRLQDFLDPLLQRLDQEPDRRLVKTFAATILVFLKQRYRASGLLPSEPGRSSPLQSTPPPARIGSATCCAPRAGEQICWANTFGGGRAHKCWTSPAERTRRWWTTRGEHAEEKRSVESELLRPCAQSWSAAVLHVFDRGYAGAPWLREIAATGSRSVLRWQTKYHLRDCLGRERPAWQFARGRRTQDHHQTWETRAQAHRRMDVAIPVRHWAYPGPLWLVVSRRGPGYKPWYRLTNEVADTPRAAWRVIFACAGRSASSS